MRDNTQILTMLKVHEGLRLKPYLCKANKVTIGYGCNVQDTENAQMLKFYNFMSKEDIIACMDRQEDFSITEELAEKILKVQLEQTQREASKLIPHYNELSINRQDALTDMLFNLGATRFLKFKKMLKALDNRYYDRVAHEMHHSLWFKQVGSRADRLVLMVQIGFTFEEVKKAKDIICN